MTRLRPFRFGVMAESVRGLSEVFAEIASTTKDAAQADAFEMLAPIPSGVASAMIQALAATGNHPVGAKPPVTSAPKPPAAPPVAPPRASVPPAQPLSAAPAPSVQVPPHEQPAARNSLPWGVIVVGLIAAVWIVSRIAKGSRR